MTTERDTLELRRIFESRIEIRKEGPDTYEFNGYASVTGKEYKIAGGPPVGWHETIERGAFKKTLSEKPDVVFLVNHEGLPLARTVSGTLRLTEDATGLKSRALLDASDPDVQRIVPKIDRGDLTEMSFAFRVMRQRWTDDDGVEVDSWRASRRFITEVNLNRGDVSTVTYGANPYTSGTLRIEDALDVIARHDPALLVAARSSDARLDQLVRDARRALEDPERPRTMSVATARALAAVDDDRVLI